MTWLDDVGKDAKRREDERERSKVSAFRSVEAMRAAVESDLLEFARRALAKNAPPEVSSVSGMDKIKDHFGESWRTDWLVEDYQGSNQFSPVGGDGRILLSAYFDRASGSPFRATLDWQTYLEESSATQSFERRIAGDAPAEIRELLKEAYAGLVREGYLKVG